MKVRSGYKQTEVGVIPEEWHVKTIEQVAFVTSGKRLPLGSSLVDTPTPHPYIRVTDMRPGTVDTSEIKFVPESAFPAIKRYRIFRSDIFISVAGSLGIVGKIPAELDGANLTENADRITDITCFQDYLLYVLLSPLIQNAIDSIRTVGAQPKLALTRIRKFAIPIPPTDTEQRAVAAALSDVDALLERLTRLIAKKRDVKRAVAQQLTSGATRLSGFCGAWPIAIFESLCKTFTKQTGFDYTASIKPSLTFNRARDSLPFIQNKDFSGRETNYETDYFIPESVARNFPRILLDERCLLISISGRVGNVGVFSSSQKSFVGGAIAVAKFWDTRQLDWAMYYLQSSVGQNKLLVNVKAGSHQNLILEDLRKMEIPLPSADEQREITTILSDLDAELAALEARRDKTRALKQAMMQELLSGRTRLVPAQ